MDTTSTTTWEKVTESGTYYDLGTGELYQIPHEALRMGSGPLIKRFSPTESKVIKVSTDPFIGLDEARSLVSKSVGVQATF